MSSVQVSQLSEQEVAQLACTYASLILHDDGIDITDKNITKVIKSTGLKVQSFWPSLFAKSLAGKNVADLLVVSGPASGGNQQQTAPETSNKEAPKKEEKKEEPKNEEEEEDFDMGDLFG